jgi:tetratricopeptide (TPR) repeat protein
MLTEASYDTAVELTIPQALERAASACRSGAWADAEQLCRLVLAASPGSFDALHLLGVTMARSGRTAEAVALLGAASAANPRSAEAAHSLALAQAQSGAVDAALASFDRARALAPARGAVIESDASALLASAGRHADALARCDRALAIDPALPAAHYNRGNALRALARPAEAAAAYERALALDPGLASAHGNLAAVLVELDRPAEALAHCEQALALAPDYVDALANRGKLLLALDRPGDALASLDAALARAPQHADALQSRGTALRRLGRVDEALASYESALACDPRHADACNNRGTLLAELDRHEEALACYERALELAPRHAEAHYNRGNALRDLERYPEAVASYDAALACAPAHVSAAWNRSLVKLAVGDFADGWRNYERRWDTVQQAPYRRTFASARWTGDAPLAGQRILLHAEQGFGDTLQFCRYVPRVAALGAQVLLEVQAPLVPLLAGLAGAAQVIAAGDPLPAFDWHCPLLSLPLAFHTDLGSIPADVPYLAADPARVAAWRTRLGPRSAPRIGFACRGRPTHGDDRRRSLPVAALAALVERGGDWICLQPDVDARELQPLANVRSFAADLPDFAETAALVAQMDVVVTVDTSVAHLAGALGKPVWILLPTNADWRWLTGRDDSPWYPTARLFRQPAMGDWASVIARVRAELQQFLATSD